MGLPTATLFLSLAGLMICAHTVESLPQSSGLSEVGNTFALDRQQPGSGGAVDSGAQAPAKRRGKKGKKANRCRTSKCKRRQRRKQRKERRQQRKGNKAGGRRRKERKQKQQDREQPESGPQFN